MIVQARDSTMASKEVYQQPRREGWYLRLIGTVVVIFGAGALCVQLLFSHPASLGHSHHPTQIWSYGDTGSTWGSFKTEDALNLLLDRNLSPRSRQVIPDPPPHCPI